MVPTCGAGVTAAAGTSLAHHLFPKIFALEKSTHVKCVHSEFPYHACAHCKVFVPAAPRGARTSISVSFSGQPLSRPLPVLGLVSHYLANSLMGRRLILRRCLSIIKPSTIYSLPALILTFARLSRTSRKIIDVLLSSLPCPCGHRLAWLNRIPIAATSCRINRYLAVVCLTRNPSL